MTNQITFPLTTDFDFASNEDGLGSTALLMGFKFCVGYKVTKVEEDGPGGGWPNFEVEFQTKEELDQFLTKYYDGRQEEISDFWEMIS